MAECGVTHSAMSRHTTPPHSGMSRHTNRLCHIMSHQHTLACHVTPHHHTLACQITPAHPSILIHTTIPHSGISGHTTTFWHAMSHHYILACEVTPPHSATPPRPANLVKIFWVPLVLCSFFSRTFATFSVLKNVIIKLAPWWLLSTSKDLLATCLNCINNHIPSHIQAYSICNGYI